MAILNTNKTASTLLFAVFTLMASLAAAESPQIHYEQLEAGSLLISTAKTQGTEFYHTVVYITQHGEDGTHGFIINKPTHMTVNEAMPDNMRLEHPSKLYFGGPMHAQFLFVLTQAHKYPELHDIVQGLYFGAGDKAMIEINRVSHDETRTFIGFSSWGPGQLRKELDNEVWLVAPGSIKDVFDEHPEELWQKLYKQWSGDWI
ncbi:MAG: YqgE/AlgH family protein [Gammaproteobacteria bacterium]|nr:YqgE/AlgH family protein [Gammaproteobacteria bacterium]